MASRLWPGIVGGPTRDLWRTTTSRLTLLYGLIFALGILTLLGVVYWQSRLYLNARTDHIVTARAEAFMRYGPDALPQELKMALAIDGAQINVYALFSREGQAVFGNLSRMPPGLEPDARPIDMAPTREFPKASRVVARRLPWGEVLVVGRDVSQLQEMRAIILVALAWSAVGIIAVGLVCGAALSLSPIRRVRMLQAAIREIAAGRLDLRLPVSVRHDELDMFASTVNHMIEEIERLMFEVRGVTDSIAHDLRTPLTRARARLARLPQSQALDDVIAELDAALERFSALLRISRLEASERRAGFTAVDPFDLLREAAELYGPLAEAEGVSLTVEAQRTGVVQADAKLLFEALSNLVDNAIKFTPAGGAIVLRLEGGGPAMVVEDDGPGVPAAEQAAVLQRFYRAERDRLAPGSGLGLSIVAAIVRLHGFALRLEDAGPGLRAVIDCAPDPEI